MTVYRLKTFEDVIDACLEELGVQASDTTRVNRLKRDINIAYQEVVSETRWKWAAEQVSITHEAAFTAGSCAVTNNSTTVTLSEAPTKSVEGYWFSASSNQTRYRIKSHTAGDTTLTLERPYVDNTNAGTSLYIWTDEVALPAIANEVTEVWHDIINRPLENYSHQEFRKYVSNYGAKTQGYPTLYTTDTYRDPVPASSVGSLPSTASVSSAQFVKTVLFSDTLGATASTAYLRVGDRIQVRSATDDGYNTDEAIIFSLSTTTATNDTIQYIGTSAKTETNAAPGSISIKKTNQGESGERYRRLLVHPALHTVDTIIHVDFIKDAAPLENDSDEPIIPLEYRSVLMYKALARQWAKLGSPDNASRNRAEGDLLVKRMKGYLEDSVEKAQIKINRRYVNRSRSKGGRSLSTLGGFAGGSGGGGGGAQQLQGTANRATEFDSNGRLKSSDITSTELSYLDGATSNLQAQIDALNTTFLDEAVNLTEATLADASTDQVVTSMAVATYTAFHFMYTLTRGSTVEAGQIKVISDGTSAWVSTDFAGPGTTGVSFDADVSAGNLRLLYTTTSTGDAATMKFKGHRWLA